MTAAAATPTTMDNYQLKWHSHTNHLNGSVAALYRSERFTDVVLCTMDGHQIPAHRFVLSSCSIYMSALLDTQRHRFPPATGLQLYVVLPPEITTKALQILIEYMYRGETTVSNDILDVVLQAGDLLKVRGLWRQGVSAEDDGKEKRPPSDAPAKQTAVLAQKKHDTAGDAPKISVKRDDKLLKTFTPVQHLNLTRQSFVGPPKLVFIKSQDGAPTLGALMPKTTPQTIIVTPDLQHHVLTENSQDKDDNQINFTPTVRVRKTDKKYGKRAKHESVKSDSQKSKENKSVVQVSKEDEDFTNIPLKSEPEWEEECDPNQDEIFETDVLIKPEIEDMIGDVMDEEEVDEQIYSPLTCELCSEVFHIPAEWVRHIQGHAESVSPPTCRKRKSRSSSDDTEETALLRCDLCQKHFPNPGEWVRHIQSTHTESELAISNNSAPPRRHNRYIDGDQNKTCDHCKKVFPSHASMVIHLRTHTGERPFICGLCNKGFNVKSNLLRHLRTLHDTIVGPGNIPHLQDDLIITTTSPSDSQPSTSNELKQEAPS